MEVACDLISLDLAVTVAEEAGADADALVAAARAGALDTVQIDGLPYLRRSELSIWLRFGVINADSGGVLALTASEAWDADPI